METNGKDWMRAWEFMAEGKYDLEMERYDVAPVGSPHQRTPLIGLRHINKLKKIKASMAQEQAQRRKLMALMYAVPEERDDSAASPVQQRQDEIDLALKELELRKAQLEMEKEENRWRSEIRRMAKHFINNSDDGK